MAPQAVLSEHERLVLQQEEALKRERQELEAWKLETRSIVLCKRSSCTQEPAPLKPKRARSLTTASCRSFSPKGTTHEGPVLLLSLLRPAEVLNVPGQASAS